MTLAEYFALQRGNQSAFVKKSGLGQSFVSQLSLGLCAIPMEHGAAIERATGGLVTRQDMFPDTWARIWPELATPTLDHAAELRAALTQTSIVFERVPEGAQVLAYLTAVLRADSPATADWLQGGLLPDQDQPESRMDAGAGPATPAPAAPIVTKLTVEVDTSAIDAAMAKLDALKASAAETRAALAGLHVGAAPAPASPLDRLTTEVRQVSEQFHLPGAAATQMLILAELRKAARRCDLFGSVTA